MLGARPVRAPRGSEMTCRSWGAEAALRMLHNNLDPEVADRGLAFMRASLTDDNRSPAFGPEQPAPDDADPYQRVAAFAGRSV